MEKIKVEKRFKKDAKQIVDMLFEAKLFRDDITRDDMNVTENFISDLMSMSFEFHLKANELLKRMESKTE